MLRFASQKGLHRGHNTSAGSQRMSSSPSREGRSPLGLVPGKRDPRFHSFSFVHTIPPDCKIIKRKIVNNLNGQKKRLIKSLHFQMTESLLASTVMFSVK